MCWDFLFSKMLKRGPLIARQSYSHSRPADSVLKCAWCYPPSFSYFLVQVR